MLKEICMKEALQATLEGKEVKVFILDEFSVTKKQGRKGEHPEGNYQFITLRDLLKNCCFVVDSSQDDGSTENIDALVSIDEISNILQISVRRVQQLTSEGILKAEDTINGKRYMLAKSIKGFNQYSIRKIPVPESK